MSEPEFYGDLFHTLWGSLGPLWSLWKWSSAHVYARGRKQCCKLHYCLWRVSIKPRLPCSYLLCVLCFQRQSFWRLLVYRFRKIIGKSNFSEQFRKLINRYKRIGYSLDIMRQTACLVVNPIIVDGYASLFNCTTAVRASDSMTASS